jgi:hypothetical protein
MADPQTQTQTVERDGRTIDTETGEVLEGTELEARPGPVEVRRRERPEFALARLDPQSLLEKAIEKGAAIEVLERFVALAERVQANQARQAWYDAMAEFQRQCPRILKTRKASISTKGGSSFGYLYAPLDDILDEVQPIMGEYGLSVSWAHEYKENSVSADCKISHALGHSEKSGAVWIPIPAPGETGATGPQRVGIAMTYAKRYSFEAVSGIQPSRGDDNDASRNAPPSSSQGQPGRVEDEGGAAGDPSTTITEGQNRKFWAIARGEKWSDADIHDLLTSKQIEDSTKIPRGALDGILDTLKGGAKAWREKIAKGPAGEAARP